ncbi:corticotropin-releasing factor receptor 1-like [Elysia marginata]|uniref:Corticotropin-releasing factor receptor 1-like n=1 Tax=Elysia marginata TaxID=1093978 RepID=A0AAV4EIS1_9GAST|nr:corticotropin-releasing factor receptor 1-like [Elysia marginata]
MQVNHDTKCWADNSGTAYILIIYVPIMLALLINLLILMNLVRIVIAKLCSGHTNERSKICRTIKSTVLLVFLLGIINLIFFYRPKHKELKIVYRYVNAILPPLQVQRALKKRWNRFKDSRNMNGQSYMRRRSSRTSMTMFVSNHNPSHGPETHLHVMEMQPLKDNNGVNNLNN